MFSQVYCPEELRAPLIDYFSIIVRNKQPHKFIQSGIKLFKCSELEKGNAGVKQGAKEEMKLLLKYQFVKGNMFGECILSCMHGKGDSIRRRFLHLVGLFCCCRQE